MSVPKYNKLTVDTCGSSYDTAIALSSECSKCLSIDDDGCTAQSSKIIYYTGETSPASVDYYIHVGGHNTNHGDFFLSVVCEADPPQNQPLPLVNTGEKKVPPFFISLFLCPQAHPNKLDCANAATLTCGGVVTVLGDTYGLPKSTGCAAYPSFNSSRLWYDTIVKLIIFFTSPAC